MHQPRVTVGMPVYNDPAGLRRSVPTVFGQTWGGPVRLLVVDDGSTDETADVLASLAAIYDEIEIVRNPVNLGRPFARNKIIELAGDDYLAWLDAGDLWLPRKLELQMATLRREEAADPDTPLLCTGPLRWHYDDRAGLRIRVPEVAGDQLHNALTGTLFPYLQAMLGKAEHFRAVGGFDSQLLRRQDYDFLVRFVGEGGRVVGTREDVPLFTYRKSYVGGSAEQVVNSNRIIRGKHREYYRRFGWRLARRIRGNQHRLVARFYRNNGKRALGMAHSAAAELVLLDPVSGARRGAGVFWPPSRAFGRLVRVSLRVARPALPLLRRPGVIAFARKSGLLRLLNATGVMRAVYGTVKSHVKEAGAFSPRPAAPMGELPAAIVELEAVVASEPDPAPEAWLRLDKVYQDFGLLHSAESALTRGLKQHAGNAELRVRLIELLALRRKWAECVEAWAAGDGLPEQDLREVTYARVARSYRNIDDFPTALAVAEAGNRRWPDDPRLWDEMYMNRAALVDWQRVLVPAASAEPDGAAGVVTDLGFLAGRDAPLTGRVPARASGAMPVTLEVNGSALATTYAAGSAADHGWFSFALSCHDMRHYLGDGDVISVSCEGKPLTIEGYGTRCAVVTGYPSRYPELVKALDDGKVFTKFGVLRTGNTKLHKKQTLELYDAVSAVLGEVHGYSTYPFYGNLLGAVRENDFIGHDVGGFDMGYISRLHHPDEVRAEFLAICRTLVDRGYFLRLEPWSSYVRPARNSPVFVDLNYAWFTDAGELNFSFGWRWPPVTDEARTRQPRTCPIGTHLVNVPGNAEAVLEQFYGPSWAIPNQGFSIANQLKRDESSLLTIAEMTSFEALDPDRVQAELDEHPQVAT